MSSRTSHNGRTEFIPLLPTTNTTPTPPPPPPPPPAAAASMDPHHSTIPAQTNFSAPSPLSQSFAFPHKPSPAATSVDSPRQHPHHARTPSSQSGKAKPSLSRLYIDEATPAVTMTQPPSQSPSPTEPTMTSMSAAGGGGMGDANRGRRPSNPLVHPSELAERLQLPENAHTDALHLLRSKLDHLRSGAIKLAGHGNGGGGSHQAGFDVRSPGAGTPVSGIPPGASFAAGGGGGGIRPSGSMPSGGSNHHPFGDGKMSASPTRGTPALSDPTSVRLGGQDAFFARLERIRSLQGDIRKLHSDLEGVGLGWEEGEVGSKKPEGGAAKSDSERAGAEGKSGDKAAAAEGKADDELFDRCKQSFMQRQSKVEEIMNKLSTLSSSLISFHTLPTPSLQFPASTPQPGTTPTSASASRVPTLRASSPLPVQLGRSALGRSAQQLQQQQQQQQQPSPLTQSTSRGREDRGSLAGGSGAAKVRRGSINRGLGIS